MDACVSILFYRVSNFSNALDACGQSLKSLERRTFGNIALQIRNTQRHLNHIINDDGCITDDSRFSEKIVGRKTG